MLLREATPYADVAHWRAAAFRDAERRHATLMRATPDDYATFIIRRCLLCLRLR